MEGSSKAITYDNSNFKKLTAEFKTLGTFSAVATWDSQAQLEIEKLVRAVHDIDAETARLQRTLADLERAKAERSFFEKLFSGNKQEKETNQLIEEYGKLKTAFEGMASLLQESIDFTPNSPEEQTSLIKELRQRKKELQIEKREVAATMKAVRDSARQRSAQAGQALGGLLYSSKSAAIERRGIRYDKERILRPHEDAKAAIERQIVQVDRDILWAEKFRD